MAVLFTPHAIGADLEVLRRELVSCGNDLKAALPARAGLFIDDSMQVLERLVCRIAVIGQVKGGKSSFINAFVRRPGLLPTDVNPWTTAVTHLHFGRTDAPAGIGAEFTFFDSDEWEKLATGGGFIRELTRRLVPGFEVELLQKHVDAMRRRSEDRLGETLPTLLGKKHLFPSLTPDVLERYVCSGEPGPASVDPAQKGFYSDVVKSADVYFSGNDFGFATTIIDTPGTNDPFLVRDEITRRALESADIYVVVLTARQALSSADVALLRILRGLHKDCIAVFVNRIDELEDVVRDTRQIVEQVRVGLKREFPDADIPIVAGSAHWANVAMGGVETAIERAWSARTRSYALHLAERAGALPLAAALHGENSPEQAARSLLLCSGLPALAGRLSALVLRSHAGHVLGRVTASFSQLAQMSRNTARHELEVGERDRLSESAREERSAEELRQIQTEVDENERLTTTLHSLLIDLQSRTEQLIEDYGEGVVEALRDVVDGFAQQECADFVKASLGRTRHRVWRCQTSTLRRTLEEEFVASFRKTEVKIADLDRSIVPRLQQLLASYGDDGQKSGEIAPPQPRPELPSLSALGQMVALDLAEPWWKRLWSGARSIDEQAAELDRLIRQEFYPVVDQLVAASRVRLKLNQAALLQQSTMVVLSLVEVLQGLNRSRLERTRELMATRGEAGGEEGQAARAAHLEQLRVRVSATEHLGRRLETIERVWAAKMG